MQSPVFLQYCLKLKDIVVLMEELFYSNHPFSCSGGMGGMGGTPPQAQILTTIFPLATGIPKLQNDIFEIWCS